MRLDGSISSKRTWGEITRLFKLGVVLLIIPLSFVAVNGMVIYFVHNYIIPIPIATNIFSVFDEDVAILINRIPVLIIEFNIVLNRNRRQNEPFQNGII
ncbi:MAG: hypothetical protein IMF10_06765 [Proteobacteria bacterium]|nr:hypothetical protein [Pseudomonadota bacterium]